MFTTKRDLYYFVSYAKEKHGIKNSSYPLNLIDMCEERSNLDLEYLNIKTKGLCGIAFIGAKSDTIILNTNRNEKERNYDCAHEVIHLLKHRNFGYAEFHCYEKTSSIQLRSLEWQANEGAAEILVPYKMLLPFIYENKNMLEDWASIYTLIGLISKHFKVTDSVVKYRLESLKYEIHQFLNGTKLDDLIILSASKQNEAKISVPSINDIAITKIVEDHLNSVEYNAQHELEEAGYGDAYYY